MYIRRRLQSFRRLLKSKGLKAAYITSPISRRYLSGFTGTTGMVFITPNSTTLFTDFRYTERAQEQVAKEIIVEDYRNHLTRIKESLKTQKISKLGFENREMSVYMHALIAQRLKSIRLVPIDAIVEDARAPKGEDEIIILKKAIKASEQTLVFIQRWLKKRIRANRMPTELETLHAMRDFVHAKKLGELPLETIVAFGKNTSRPHHECSSSRLRKDDAIIIDLGVIVNGYYSDMARTFFVGKPKAKLIDMYETILQAQDAGFSYIKEGGRSAERADTVARKIIENKYPNSFGHAFGHGVGLAVHEQPTLSMRSPHKLKKNSIFMLEPGIYIPHEAGVRVEDLVLLTKKGPKYLSGAPKALKSVIL